MLPKLAIASVGAVALAIAIAPMAQRLLFMLPASNQTSNQSNGGNDKGPLMSTTPIKVGLVGAADIAKFAVLWPASREPSIAVHAVAARNVDKAKVYAQKHGIPVVHENYRELIMDPSIDVIYVGVVTELHYAITKFALENNKHVLLEKPAVFLEHEAKELSALSQERDRILFEAFHWRYHPAAIRVHQLLAQEKVVGDLQSIELKASLYDPKASNASEQGASKQFVKLYDRWCYLVDEIHFYLNKDEFVIETKSVEMHPTKMHAELIATPRNDPDLERGEGGKSKQPIHITMNAYKDKLEIPSWYIDFQGSNGNLRYDNALFPFIYHRIVKPNGKVEKQYTQDESDDSVGKTTFAYQLDEFVRIVKETNPTTRAKTNDKLLGSMIRNAQLAEALVSATDQLPVASWAFPQMSRSS